MHCHTHPMKLISHLSPRFATSQVSVFDRPLLRVTVTHPAVSEHPTERAQCVHVQSEFPPADSFSPASSLKCFTRSSSARHGKSSADVIRPAASDSRADRRGCVSVCVQNFCKHWWLCCNSIIYLPFFRNVLNEGWSLFETQQLWKYIFFFFGVTTSKTLQFVKILPFSTHRHADGRLWWHVIIRATLFETLGNKAGRVCEHKWKQTPCSSCGFLQLSAWLGTPFFSLSLSKLRHSDLLARKDPPLPPKTRAEVPLSLGTEQLPAVWKVFSVFTSTCWNPARPPGYCGNKHGVAIWTESGPTSCSVWRPPFTWFSFFFVYHLSTTPP